MTGKCTMDAVFILGIQEECLSTQMGLYMCFVDLKMEFD